ncbi:hypothetical protein [Enterococcus malodoratus]|uniref:Fimbrial assembly protein n=1 Tax=Enterococcus malodoratus ATCC 43197 TaxID=1158601 RepID=R2QZG7_9ENTE|nr:hypothetical protein [Enterococcus malodoratus]EOH76830.1 hypothetical protein UAI_02505 [Enterococcus malodoratus ATCC 43197]EOT63469.1 hypothetical protein I585_04299 [Enterococcus malodoratus ATCC 43197]SPW69416.1 signal peptidase I [Enterococcus malodoratus]STD65790.1 signal peptidase I [Enterococcus malodoratus]
MIIINWICIGLIIVVLLVWLYRMVINVRLQLIKPPRDASATFQRKLDYVRQIQQTKHISALLFVTFCLAVGVLLTTYSLFQVQDQLYAVNEQNNALKDDVQVMKKEQKKLVNKLPVKEYPKEGIGLEEYSWDDLFSDDSREKQYAMESDLSNKLSPYFGLPTTLIVLDIPTQTLNIALAGDLTSEDNRQQIKKNIQAFATEAEGVSNLTQITFQLNVRDGEKQKQDYSCTFSRENGEDKFLMIQED